MSERRPEQSRLIAFVDGELPPAEARALRALLERDAELHEQVERLRALRILSRDAVRGATPPAPDGLRLKVVDLVRDWEPARGASAAPLGSAASVDGAAGVARDGRRDALPRRERGAGFGRRARWAVAAGLAAALVGGLWVTIDRLGGNATREVVIGREASGLSVERVSLLQARHLKCVMMGNNFMDPAFPKVLEEVGPSVRAFLGGDVQTPDLSGIGLTFAGVGPCDMPGGKTLHWLYRKETSAPGGANVSLFVQPYAGQVSLGVDKVVVVAGPTAEYPLLVWRSEKFVYFLIGDDFGATSAAARSMGVSFGGG